MIEYQVLYWRDIPAQIKVFAARRSTSAPLPERFQLAIDRIAMAAGLTGTDGYLEQWHWSERRVWDGDGEEAIAAIVRQVQEEGEQVLAAYGEMP